jgi:hypothetical protein
LELFLDFLLEFTLSLGGKCSISEILLGVLESTIQLGRRLLDLIELLLSLLPFNDLIGKLFLKLSLLKLDLGK